MPGTYHATNLTTGFSTAVLLCPMLVASLVISSCATTDLQSEPRILIHGQLREKSTGESLKVLTLNLAHGRGDGFHQLLQDTETTLENLNEIATLLDRVDPDVVSLQEADGPSFWSGNFDHVIYLAERGDFGRSVHGAHVDGLGLSYGTAVLSQLELRQPEAITFSSKDSPVPKGFIVSTIAWPGRNQVEVDVVSVHLDFTSELVRTKQATELIETLKRRNRPRILMGDFNTDWQHEDSSLRYIARELSLRPYEPDDKNLNTFLKLGARLDWILVSAEMQFLSYHVAPDVVSDHRGVVAELVIAPAASNSVQCGERPGSCFLQRD